MRLVVCCGEGRWGSIYWDYGWTRFFLGLVRLSVIFFFFGFYLVDRQVLRPVGYIYQGAMQGIST